jgi:hypothetical protein
LSKSRGFRIVFYPFILMDDGGKSWRGRIGYESADVSSGADTAVSNFLGSAATSQFTQDFTNKTVLRSHGFAARGRPPDAEPESLLSKSANSWPQATALVVEQSAFRAL